MGIAGAGLVEGVLHSTRGIVLDWFLLPVGLRLLCPSVCVCCVVLTKSVQYVSVCMWIGLQADRGNLQHFCCFTKRQTGSQKTSGIFVSACMSTLHAHARLHACTLNASCHTQQSICELIIPSQHTHMHA